MGRYCPSLVFPDSSVGKESACNAGDPSSIPGSGRSAGDGIGYHSSILGFSRGSAGKESTCNAGDLGSVPGLGRFPGEGKGYLLQYSGLENSMDCVVPGILQARILEWGAFPFSRGSSQPRDQTQVSRIAGGFFTS